MGAELSCEALLSWSEGDQEKNHQENQTGDLGASAFLSSQHQYRCDKVQSLYNIIVYNIIPSGIQIWTTLKHNPFLNRINHPSKRASFKIWPSDISKPSPGAALEPKRMKNTKVLLVLVQLSDIKYLGNLLFRCSSWLKKNKPSNTKSCKTANSRWSHLSIFDGDEIWTLRIHLWINNVPSKRSVRISASIEYVSTLPMAKAIGRTVHKKGPKIGTNLSTNTKIRILVHYMLWIPIWPPAQHIQLSVPKVTCESVFDLQTGTFLTQSGQDKLKPSRRFIKGSTYGRMAKCPAHWHLQTNSKIKNRIIIGISSRWTTV